jgi:hypothetical protein
MLFKNCGIFPFSAPYKRLRNSILQQPNSPVKMKKLVYFLVFSSIVACQKSEKSSSNEVVMDMKTAAAGAIAAPSEAMMDTLMSPSATQKTSVRAKDKSRPEEKDAEAETQTPQNVFEMPLYTTTSRKIIRTAQVKTKVEQTEKATYQIESMARKWQGFVTSNNLENRVQKQEEIPVSADSMLQIIHSEAVNTMSVRVPNRHLDSFLMEISRIYTHLDYRRVQAEDLTAAFLTNQLKSELRNQSSKRIAAATDEQGKRLNDIVAAEQSRVEMSDEAIGQKVQNVETDYNIAYSVVTIEIYADRAVSKSIIPTMTTAHAPFLIRCQQAVANGWAILLDIFIGILNLWVFILFGFLAYRLYRWLSGSVFAKLALSRKE